MRQWIVSALVAAALVSYLLRQVDPSRLLEIFSTLHWPSVWLFVGLSTAGLVARAFRYHILLRTRVGFGRLLLVTLVRNLFADLLPARIGTVSFVYLVTRRCGVPLPDGLAAFLLAFVFDMLAIVPLIVIALLVVGAPTLPGGAGAWIVATLVLAVTFSAAYLALAPALAASGRVLAGSARSKVAAVGRALDLTARALQDARRRGVGVPVLGISLLIRLAKFSGFYVLLHGVLAAQGYGWADLPPFRVFLGVAGAELSAMLPVHGLAGLGTYEAAWALGFAVLLGLGRDLAILSGFATHLLSQIHDYGLGALALLVIMSPWFAPRPLEAR